MGSETLNLNQRLSPVSTLSSEKSRKRRSRRTREGAADYLNSFLRLVNAESFGESASSSPRACLCRGEIDTAVRNSAIARERTRIAL